MRREKKFSSDFRSQREEVEVHHHWISITLLLLDWTLDQEENRKEFGSQVDAFEAAEDSVIQNQKERMMKL